MMTKHNFSTRAPSKNFNADVHYLSGLKVLQRKILADKKSKSLGFYAFIKSLWNPWIDTTLQLKIAATIVFGIFIFCLSIIVTASMHIPEELQIETFLKEASYLDKQPVESPQ